MAFAAALSEHPIPATALGEVVGELMEKLGEGVDLVCLFVSPHHAGALEDIAGAVHTLLDPKVSIGCAAEAVIGSGREVEGSPAIALWGGNVGPVHPLRLEVVDTPTGGKALGGWPIDLPYVPGGAIILGDPFSFPVNTLFDVLNGAGGFPRVMGGMASAGKAPGSNRLVLNGDVVTDGAVGVLIGANDDVRMQTLVSQGCRPIGRPFVATKTTGNVIYELGGQAAFERLSQMVKAEISEDDMGLAQNGLLVGRVIDEHKPEFGPGDFVVRTLISADPLEGSLTVGEKIDVGTTIQFHVRDSFTADIELFELLSQSEAQACLLFSDSGRGTALFEDPSHDAQMIADALDDPPTAGCFTAGEFGPLGGRNLVHGFSASMALFLSESRS